jgi:hypothetical protein
VGDAEFSTGWFASGNVAKAVKIGAALGLAYLLLRSAQKRR